MQSSTARVRRWPAIPRSVVLAISALLLAACSSAAGESAISTPHHPASVASAAIVASEVSAVYGGSAADPIAAGSETGQVLPGGVITDVTFVRPEGCSAAACSVLLDIYVPRGSGPFPTVVLVRGGPTGAGGRGYLDPFASELAESGIIVFNADMRDMASKDGGYPEAFDDVACAVRFARTWSFAYGGDGSSVTLVGHSLGGFVGSVVALNSAQFTGDCLASGSGRPDAFVGLSGNYNLSDPKVANDLQVFFGGTPEETAEARSASNPFNYATGSPIPVDLVAGTDDQTVNPAAAVSLNAYLTERGWNVTLTLIPGATHNSIIVPTGAGPQSMAVVERAVESAAAG
ncbi:MAG: alpha/beta hydrolase family protein [Candidatus Limnocylindrales bacterium]